MAVTAENIEIGGAKGAIKHPVQHRAAIDEEVLLGRGTARIGGQGGIALQAQAVTFRVDAQGVFGEVAAKDAGKPPLKRVEQVTLLRVGAEKGARFAPGHVAQGKANRRFRHGQTTDNLGHSLQLGAV